MDRIYMTQEEYRALRGMIHAGEKAALSLLDALKDRTEIINYAANERISGLLSWYNNEFQKGDAPMVVEFTADDARENVARYEEMAAQNRQVLAEEFIRTEILPAVRQKSLNGVSALLSKYCIPHEAFAVVKSILEAAGYVVESNNFTREYRVSWEPVEEPEPEPDPDGEGDG